MSSAPLPTCSARGRPKYLKESASWWTKSCAFPAAGEVRLYLRTRRRAIHQKLSKRINIICVQHAVVVQVGTGTGGCSRIIDQTRHERLNIEAAPNQVAANVPRARRTNRRRDKREITRSVEPARPRRHKNAQRRAGGVEPQDIVRPLIRDVQVSRAVECQSDRARQAGPNEHRADPGRTGI